jgi:hypothetical protein
MDVVKTIGAVQAAQQGTPATPIVIESIRIKTS